MFKRISSAYQKELKRQGQPKPYLIFGIGFITWKWCGMFLPSICFTVSDFLYVCLNEIFDHGTGIFIKFGSWFSLTLAYKGKIAWWYKYKFHLMIFNRLYFYQKINYERQTSEAATQTS